MIFQLARATVHNPKTGLLDIAKFRITQTFVTFRLSVSIYMKLLFLELGYPMTLITNISLVFFNVYLR